MVFNAFSQDFYVESVVRVRDGPSLPELKGRLVSARKRLLRDTLDVGFCVVCESAGAGLVVGSALADYAEAKWLMGAGGGALLLSGLSTAQSLIKPRIGYSFREYIRSRREYWAWKKSEGYNPTDKVDALILPPKMG